MDRLHDFGFLLAELSRRYVRLFEQLAQEAGLNLPTCRVLAYLQRQQGISQSRLAELAGLEPMALVRLLDRLQADNLVLRQPDPSDRRAHRLQLGDAAPPVLRRIGRLSRRAREQAFDGIDDAQRAAFLGLLERLVDNLQAGLQPSPGRSPQSRA